MKTAHVPLIPALLLLSTLLPWGDGALHGQEVQPRQTTKLDPGLIDTYVGQYELAPKVLLTLRREGHHLMAQVTGQPWFVVYVENAMLPEDYQFTADDAGVHTFTTAFQTAGTHFLRAMDTVFSNLFGEEDGIVVV